MQRHVLTYVLLCLVLLWSKATDLSAEVTEISKLRQVASIEQVQDTACPQSFRQLFCTGLISNANCELCLPCMGDTMPDYYCDCLDGIPFHYGLDTIITDTVWFTARVQDVLSGGLTAYWFSDSVVSIGIYIACNLKRPNKQIDLTRNSSRIMSPDDLKSMLGNAGEIGSMLGNKPVYIRVAPRAKGRVMLYKYGDSFRSDCGDSIFSVYYGIQYALGYEHTVYRMPRIRQRNLKFINWIQKENKPVKMSIIRGDCVTGDTVAQVVLTDSVYPYMANTALMQDVYQKNDSLYFVFDRTDFGKVIFRNTAKYPASYRTESDTVMCQGAQFDNGAIVVSDTSFVDTLWIRLDTLSVRTTTVTMVSPEPVVETMLLKSKQLPFYYHGQYITAFGDYDVTEHIDGGCDSRYLLHVEHDWTISNKTQTLTECSGKSITLKGKTYTTNKTVKDTVDNYSQDTRTITTYTLKFTAPVLEYDTLYLNKRQLPYRYEGKYVRSFGDTTITITRTNTCTRKIRLQVIETKLPLQYKSADIDTVVCRGMGLELSMLDTVVTTDGVYYDSIMIAEDTLLCIKYNLSMSEAERVEDTLFVMQREMPYQYYDTLLRAYGSYDLYVTQEGECDKRVSLELQPLMEYIEQEKDTAVCHGKVVRVGELELTEDTVLTDTTDVSDYVKAVTTWNIHFSEPEAERVLLSAKESEIPVQYSDTVLGLGTHLLFTPGNGECDRLQEVTVEVEDDWQLSEADTIECFGKSVTIGKATVKRDTVLTDTVQLSEHTWQCTTYRVTFTIPEVQKDTLFVMEGSLPVAYADTMISEYGTYQVVLSAPGECDMLVELHVIQATGVTEVREQLEVVPTIAKPGQLIRLTLSGDGVLEVIDVLGREVRTEQTRAGVMPLRLSNAGNYILKFTTRESILTRRIIITN